jgi:hypothetical protein
LSMGIFRQQVRVEFRFATHGLVILAADAGSFPSHYV